MPKQKETIKTHPALKGSSFNLLNREYFSSVNSRLSKVMRICLLEIANHVQPTAAWNMVSNYKAYQNQKTNKLAAPKHKPLNTSLFPTKTDHKNGQIQLKIPVKTEPSTNVSLGLWFRLQYLNRKDLNIILLKNCRLCRVSTCF